MSASSDIRSEATFLLGAAIATLQQLESAHQRTKSHKGAVWQALREVSDHMEALVIRLQSPTNDIMLLDCKRELIQCIKPARQMVQDLTPSNAPLL